MPPGESSSCKPWGGLNAALPGVLHRRVLTVGGWQILAACRAPSSWKKTYRPGCQPAGHPSPARPAALPDSTQRDRERFGIVRVDSPGSWCQPGQACRGGTWGETGFAGLLGSGSRELLGLQHQNRNVPQQHSIDCFECWQKHMLQSVAEAGLDGSEVQRFRDEAGIETGLSAAETSECFNQHAKLIPQNVPQGGKRKCSWEPFLAQVDNTVPPAARIVEACAWMPTNSFQNACTPRKVGE